MRQERSTMDRYGSLPKVLELSHQWRISDTHLSQQRRVAALIGVFVLSASFESDGE